MDDQAFFLNMIRMTLRKEIQDGNPTEQDIRNAIEKITLLYPLTEQEKLTLEKELQASLKVRMDLGNSVVDESTYHPWLDNRKSSIDPYYWNRYKTYLEVVSGWDTKIVDKLGDVSDEILDLCGNPADQGNWKRKGLIIGDIQSGKTSNYLALCNKAADAGYKVIILLTGTMENLRKQTQARVDAGFVGLNSRNVLQKNPEKKFIGVGNIDSNRTAYSFTNILSDFNSNTLASLGFTINGLSEPVIFVIKKNKSVLDNMATWLSTRNTSKIGDKIKLPLLLIDDEADNASVNTNKPDQNPTTINKGIVSILRLFNRSTYIGVTATPFANIFIDSDLDQGPDEFNLFPGDFIYSLSAPTNYIGADKIFGDNPEYNDSLVPIKDVVLNESTGETLFKSRNRSAHEVLYLPESLEDAIRYYVIVNAIRDLEGKERTHRSMLVNVSQYVNVQNQVYDLVLDFVKTLKQRIKSYSKQSNALRHSDIKALKRIWDKFNLETACENRWQWEDVQKQLYEASAPIVVRLVNQKSKQKGVETLDYSDREDNGLRVIAIGGNSLSRGLTLEGLIVSYFDRNSQLYDTLMQMGRWFGYRSGYENLFKIWMEPDAIDWYQYITEASNELKDSINDMRRKGLTPRDFGLKVRQNKTSLFVTARNKRLATTEIVEYISLAADLVETPRLVANIDTCLKTNCEITNSFVSKLVRESDRFVNPQLQMNNRVIYSGVPKDWVADYISGFVSHPRHIPFNGRDLGEYIRENNSLWSVALVGGSLEETLEDKYFSQELVGLGVHYSSRIITRDDSCLLISAQRSRVGIPGATECGLDKEIIKEVKKDYLSLPENEGKKTVPDKAFLSVERDPILLIYFIKIDKEQKEGRKRNSDKASIDLIGDYPVIALGLGFPGTDSINSHKVKYVLNRVGVQQMLNFEVDDENEN